MAVVAAAALPGHVWTAWSLDPLVIGGLALTALAYGAGVRRLWERGRVGRGVGVPEAAAFAGGVLAIAAALLSPLDALAGELLAAHMAQHLLLLVVAPILLVLGAPGVAFAALASPAARRIAHGVESGALARGIRALTHPVVSWLLALVALWIWHAPALYEAALRSNAVHAAEHASFLGSALLFWWTALQRRGGRRLPRGADVLYVFTGGFQGAVLGALLVFASTPIYPAYRAGELAWHVAPLADQQVAGALMWVPSGVVTLVVASALFVAWMRALERTTRRAELRATAPLRVGSEAAR